MRAAGSDRLQVLVVCTANRCRSPLAAALLARAPGDLLAVASAGTDALPDLPACPQAAAAGGFDPAGHRAAAVTVADVQAADLVLTADRGQRAVLARLAPGTRARTFTLRQAAALAGAVASAVAAGAVPAGAPALPPAADPVGRLRWLVAELDAARGTVPGGPADEDVPDPHVTDVPHTVTLPLVTDAVARLHAAFLGLI